MPVTPGDVIMVNVPGCDNCQVPEMDLHAEVLFLDKEHDLAVCKIKDTKFYAVVHFDENGNAVSQPCGDFKSIQHLLCENEDP